MPADPAARTFSAVVIQDENSKGCGVRLPFDPKDAWGKVRLPVVATINGHSYRTTVFRMGGIDWIPLSKINRTAAKVTAGDTIRITLAPDSQPRTVTPPPDLAAALERSPTARAAWDSLSFSHQREHAQAILDAKKPETRARRLEKALEMLIAKPAKAKAEAVSAKPDRKQRQQPNKKVATTRRAPPKRASSKD